MAKIMNHRDLEVYRKAFEAAMVIFRFSQQFPVEERYALTDQIRRSSRAVCANLAEAWRRRRYEGAFIDKISVAEGEAAETQVWLEFAVECGYCERDAARELYRTYTSVIATLVGMITRVDTWIIKDKTLREAPELYITTPFGLDDNPFDLDDDPFDLDNNFNR